MEKTPWLEPSPWSGRAKPTSDLKISYQLSFFLRWHKRIYTSVWISLSLACLATVYVRMQDELQWVEVLDSDRLIDFLFWLLPFSVVAALTQSAFGVIARYRLSSSIMRTRGQRCPKCFYDLSARPRDDDTCPECGMIAPRRECVRLWCKLLRSRF